MDAIEKIEPCVYCDAEPEKVKTEMIMATIIHKTDCPKMMGVWAAAVELSIE